MDVEKLKRYFGPDKVLTVSEIEQKTPKGSPIVDVGFEDGRHKLVPKMVYEKFASKSAVDATSLRDIKLKALLAEIFEVMMEYDLTAMEIKTLMQGIDNQAADAMDRAIHFMWRKEDQSWAPGLNSSQDFSLLEADAILKNIDDKKGK